MQNKTPLKIFIASSAELKEEREKFTSIINKIRKSHKHLDIEAGHWEYDVVMGNFPDHENIQDGINPQLLECEVAVFVFHSKIGKYTKQEFELATKRKKKIFAYFKNGFTPQIETLSAFAELLEFKKSLDTTVLHCEYNNLTDFELLVSDNLNLFLSEHYLHQEQASSHCRELNNIPNVNMIEFVGREKELKELHEKLMQSNRVLLMNGIGGVGKTTLAKKYVAQYRQDFNHIAFVEVKIQDDITESDTLLSTSLDAFANDIVLVSNLGLKFDEKTTNEDKFALITNQLKNLPGKGLLVIDNMPLLLSGADFFNRLPSPPNWTVLITSRNTLDGFERIELETLLPEEAVALFKKYYTDECSDEEIDELLKEIDYHTLTTELLAKTLQHTDGTMSIKSLIQKIKNRQLDDPELQEKISTAHHSKDETTIYLHLSQVLSLAKLDDDEKWILKNFAFLLPVNYTVITLIEWLQIEEVKQKEFRETLRSLLRKGWLQQKEANSYTMHRVLQQLVQYQLQPVYEDLQNLVNSLLVKLDSRKTKDFHEHLASVPYTEYFLLSLSPAVYEHNHTAILLNNLGLAYDSKGEYDKAISYYEKALAIDLKYHDEEHPNIATWYNNLGTAYDAKGKYDEAIGYYEKALAIGLKCIGEEHPDTAIRYNNLGSAFRHKGEYDKAVSYYEKAIAIGLKYHGEEHPSIAIDYNNLGLAYDNKGEYDKAIGYYGKALAIDLKYYGKEHPKIAIRYNNLGSAYDSKGEYDKAISYYEKALAIDLKYHGEVHPSIATCYNNLGLAYDSKGEYDKAIDYYEKALAIGLKYHGEKHPDIAIDYNNLGHAYDNKGEYDKAISHYEKALAIGLKYHGEEHPNIAIRYNNLGLAYDSKGEYDKAIGYYEKSLAIDLKYHDEEHPNIATRYNNLGLVYSNKVEYDKAIGYYEKSLLIFTKFLPAGHPSILTVQQNLEAAKNARK